MTHLVCRSAIERLISLGFYYRELNRFATESRDLSWIHSSADLSTPNADRTRKGIVKKGSVYRRAIANGITEILSVYRSAVLQVEQNLLSDPLPILATVTHGLNKVCQLTSRFNFVVSIFLINICLLSATIDIVLRLALLSITTNHKNPILNHEGLGNQLIYVACVY
jgi:hypothetical protein